LFMPWIVHGIHSVSLAFGLYVMYARIKYGHDDSGFVLLRLTRVATLE
jgi:hypothetical protein